jgi:hypothetical protein
MSLSKGGWVGYGSSARCSREKEWRGLSVPFCSRAVLRDKRGGDGGGLVRAMPRGGRRRGGLGSVALHGGGRHGGTWRGLASVGACSRWGGWPDVTTCVRAGDKGGGPVGVTAAGPAQEQQCRLLI